MAMHITSVANEEPDATGVFVVHSCPAQLTSLVEWALARELGAVVKLDWSVQPMQPETLKTNVRWAGPIGTAAALTSSLFGQRDLRFEITEESTATSEGGRWMHTPRLGIFHLHTDAVGNGLLSEHVVRAALAQTNGNATKLAEVLCRALGDAWDGELEPYRVAADDDRTIFLTAS